MVRVRGSSGETGGRATSDITSAIFQSSKRQPGGGRKWAPLREWKGSSAGFRNTALKPAASRSQHDRGSGKGEGDGGVVRRSRGHSRSAATAGRENCGSDTNCTASPRPSGRLWRLRFQHSSLGRQTVVLLPAGTGRSRP